MCFVILNTLISETDKDVTQSDLLSNPFNILRQFLGGGALPSADSLGTSGGNKL